MKNNLIISLIISVLLIFTVSGCSNKDEATNESKDMHSEESGHEEEGEPHEDEVALSGE